MLMLCIWIKNHHDKIAQSEREREKVRRKTFAKYTNEIPRARILRDIRFRKKSNRFTYENEWTGFGLFSVRSWRQSWNLSKTNFRTHFKINVITLCEFEHFHFIRKIAPCNSRSSALFLDYSTIKLELDATYTLECHTWKLDVLTFVHSSNSIIT